MVSFEEVKKKVRRARQKQPLAAVRTPPTTIAATPPLRLRDFLLTPYQENSTDRDRLARALGALVRYSSITNLELVDTTSKASSC